MTLTLLLISYVRRCMGSVVRSSVFLFFIPILYVLLYDFRNKYIANQMVMGLKFNMAVCTL